MAEEVALTPKQQEVLRLIGRRLQEGEPVPTTKDLSIAFDVAPGTMREFLMGLRRKELLLYDPHGRLVGLTSVGQKCYLRLPPPREVTRLESAVEVYLNACDTFTAAVSVEPPVKLRLARRASVLREDMRKALIEIRRKEA